jgi:hypothetical protein
MVDLVEAPVEVAVTEPDRLPYDESLLCKDKKGKVHAPPKLDFLERDLQIKKLNELIKQYRDRSMEIRETINMKNGSAQGVSSGGQEIFRSLQGYKSQFQTVLVSVTLPGALLRHPV